MSIQIISVGKLDKNFQVIADHYTKMLRWPVKSTEINHHKKFSPEILKNFEGKLITAAISPQSYQIALEVTGKAMDSYEFAKIIEQALVNYKTIDFIIGGAFGLDNQLSAAAQTKVSLSKMTMPHMLAKIVLLEQIYRAQTILQNHPYHK